MKVTEVSVRVTYKLPDGSLVSKVKSSPVGEEGDPVNTAWDLAKAVSLGLSTELSALEVPVRFSIDADLRGSLEELRPSFLRWEDLDLEVEMPDATFKEIMNICRPHEHPMEGLRRILNVYKRSRN